MTKTIYIPEYFLKKDVNKIPSINNFFLNKRELSAVYENINYWVITFFIIFQIVVLDKTGLTCDQEKNKVGEMGKGTTSTSKYFASCNL